MSFQILVLSLFIITRRRLSRRATAALVFEILVILLDCDDRNSNYGKLRWQQDCRSRSDNFTWVTVMLSNYMTSPHPDPLARTDGRLRKLRRLRSGVRQTHCDGRCESAYAGLSAGRRLRSTTASVAIMLL
jgi:hypothetical protein